VFRVERASEREGEREGESESERARERERKREVVQTRSDPPLATSREPLSTELATNETVRANIWHWLAPFSVQKS